MQPIYDRKTVDSYQDIDFSKVVEKDEFKYVYRPGDDSYLFLDALRLDLQDIINKKPLFCLEIGYKFSCDLNRRSGSGFLCNSLASWLKEKNYHETQFFATDINYDASVLTKKTSDSLGV